MKNLLMKLIETREHRCEICGGSLKKEIGQLKSYYAQIGKPLPHLRRKKIDIDIDHITPRSKGGITELFNLQLTHASCNNGMGDKSPL